MTMHQNWPDGHPVLVGFLVVILVLIFFSPTFIVRWRGKQHPHGPWVIALNVILGGGILPWVAALVWALWRFKKPLAVSISTSRCLFGFITNLCPTTRPVDGSCGGRHETDASQGSKV